MHRSNLKNKTKQGGDDSRSQKVGQAELCGTWKEKNSLASEGWAGPENSFKSP